MAAKKDVDGVVDGIVVACRCLSMQDGWIMARGGGHCGQKMDVGNVKSVHCAQSRNALSADNRDALAMGRTDHPGDDH
jgi:hypothetical protein